MANASSPPPEHILSWFTALEKACSKADPAHATQYKRGLQDIMDEDAQLSFQVTHDEKFPSLVDAMASKVLNLNKDAFLRECTSLLAYKLN
jgi:hypothetical protein